MNACAVRTSAVLGALLAAAAAGGCGPSNGGNDAPPGCLQVQPCGGDVVGTWTLVGGCASAAFRAEVNADLAASCPGASATGFDVAISGTITYNADLTYSSTVSESLTATETIPLSCLGSASCAAVQSTSPDATLTCTGTTTCTCHITVSPPGNETGTYTISGTNVTMISPGDTTTDGYCVENGRLHLIEISETSGAALGDFVGRKQ